MNFASQVFELFGVIALDNDPVLESLHEVEAQVDSTAQKVSGSLDSFGRGARKAGLSVSAFFAPLAAAQGYAVKLATDFESQMLTVQALTKASADEMADMTQVARDLGATTVFSASDAAEGMTYLSMAGLEVSEILEAIPGMLDLASAGTLSLGQAADITTNVMASFSYEAERSTRVADILAFAANNSNTNVTEMGQAISYAGASAAGLGVSLEDTVAGVATLANMGLKGSRAGRNYATMLGDIAQKAGDLGLNVFDAEGKMIPFADTLAQIEEKGWTTVEILETFGQISGRTLVSFMTAGSDAVREFSDELYNSADGVAEFVAQTKMSGMMGIVAELRSAVEELALSIASSGLMDAIKGWTIRITEIIRELSKLDPRLLRFATIVISVGTALGPALIILGQLSIAISALINPFGAILLAMAAIGGVVVALNSDFKGFRDIVRVVDTALYQFTGRSLRQVRRGFESARDSIVDFISSIGRIAFNSLEPVGRFLVDGLLKGIISRGTQIYASVRNWVSGLIDTVKSILGISSPSKVFQDIGHEVVDGFRQGLTRFNLVWGIVERNFMKDTTGLINRFSLLGRKMVHKFVEGIEAELTISRTFQYIEQLAKLMWIALGGFIDIAASIAGLFVDPFLAAFDTSMWQIVAYLRGKGKELAAHLMPQLREMFSDAIDSYYILDKTTYLVEGLLIEFGNVIVGYAQATVRAAQLMASAIPAIGGDIMRGFSKGLQAGWAGIENWVRNIFNGFINVVKGILGIQSPSKVFEAIGKEVSEGFRIGMGQFGFLIRDIRAAFRRDTTVWADEVGLLGRKIVHKFTETFGAELTLSATFRHIEAFGRLMWIAFNGLVDMAALLAGLFVDPFLAAFNTSLLQLSYVARAELQKFVKRLGPQAREMFAPFIDAYYEMDKTLYFIEWDLEQLFKVISRYLQAYKNAAETFLLVFPYIAGEVWKGFQKGLDAGWREAAAGLRGFFNGLIDIVKDVLGIASPSRVFQDIGESLVDGLDEGIQRRIKRVFNRLKADIQFSIDMVKASLQVFGRNLTSSYLDLAEIEGPRSNAFIATEEALSATFRGIQRAVEFVMPYLRLLAMFLAGDLILALWVVRGALRAFGVDVDALAASALNLLRRVFEPLLPMLSRLKDGLNETYKDVDRFMFQLENAFIILEGLVVALFKHSMTVYGNVLQGAFDLLIAVLRTSVAVALIVLEEFFGVDLQRVAALADEFFDRIRSGFHNLFDMVVYGPQFQGIRDAFASLEVATRSYREAVGESVTAVKAYLEQHQEVVRVAALVISGLLLGRFVGIARLIVPALREAFDLLPMALSRMAASIDNILRAMGIKTGKSLWTIQHALTNFRNVMRHTWDNLSFGAVNQTFRELGEVIRVSLRAAYSTMARFRLEIRESAYAIYGFEKAATSMAGMVYQVFQHRLKQALATFVVLVTETIPALVRGLFRSGDGIRDTFTSIATIIGGIGEFVTNVLGNILAPILRGLSAQGGVIEEIGNTVRIVMDMAATAVQALVTVITSLTTRGTALNRVVVAIADVIGTVLVHALRAVNSLFSFFAVGIKDDWGGMLNHFLGLLKNLGALVLETTKSIIVGLVRIFRGDEAAEAVKRFFGQVEQFFVDIWNFITTAYAAIKGFVTAVNNAGDATVKFFEELPGKVERFFVEAIQRALSAIGDFVGHFIQAGKDFMAGLVQGLLGGLGDVKDTVVNAGRSALDWFKGVLGIKSPSTEMAEAGRDFVRGFTQGVNEESVNAEMAVEQFGRTVGGILDFSSEGRFSRNLFSKAELQGQIEELLRLRQTMVDAGLEGTEAFSKIEDQLERNANQLDKVNQKLRDQLDTTELEAQRDQIAATVDELERVRETLEANGEASTEFYKDVVDDLAMYERDHARVQSQIMEREALVARFLQITGMTLAQFRLEFLGIALDAEEELTDAAIDGAEDRANAIEGELKIYTQAYLDRQKLFEQEDAWYRKLIEAGQASLEEFIRMLEVRMKMEALTAEEIIAIETQILAVRAEISETAFDIAKLSIDDRLALEFAGLDANIEITEAELELLRAKYEYAVLTSADAAQFQIDMLNKIAEAAGLSERAHIEIQSRIYNHQQSINTRTVRSAGATAGRVEDAFTKALQNIQDKIKVFQIQYELRLIGYDQLRSHLESIRRDLQAQLNTRMLTGDSSSEEFVKLAEALASVNRELTQLSDANRTAWLDKLRIQATYGIRPLADIKNELESVRDRIQNDIDGFKGLATTPEVLQSLLELTSQLEQVDSTLESIAGNNTQVWLDKLSTQAALGSRPIEEVRQEIEDAIASTQAKIDEFGTGYGSNLEDLAEVQRLYSLLQQLERAYQGIINIERESLEVTRAQEDAEVGRIANKEERLEREIELLQERVDYERSLLKDGETTNTTIIGMEQQLNQKRQELLEERIGQELKALEDERKNNTASYDEQEALLRRKLELYKQHNLDVAEVEAELEQLAKNRAQAELEYEDRKHRYLVEVGDISLEDHITWLEAKLEAEEEYSQNWISLQGEIANTQKKIDDEAERRAKETKEEREAREKEEARVAAERLAREQRIQDYLFATGQTSRDQYMEWLNEQLSEYEEYSSEWISIATKLYNLEKQILDEQTKEVEAARKKDRETTLERIAREREERKAQLQAVKDRQKAKEKADKEEIESEERKHRYLYDIGEISKEDHIAWLNVKLAAYEEYSEQWIAIMRELYNLETKEVEDQKDRWEELRKEVEKNFTKEDSKKIALFGVDLAKLGEEVGGVAGEWLSASSEIATGIAEIVEAGGDLEGILGGLGTMFDGLAKILPEHNSLANEAVETFFAMGGAVLELITGIPGLGKAMAGLGRIVSSVFGDMANGIQQVAEQTKEMQQRFNLIDVSKLIKTHRVSRGGFLGWLGFTKEAINEELTNLALAIAEKLEGVGNAISSSMKNFLSGATEAGGVLDELNAGVRSAIEDAIIEAVIQGAVFKGAIGDLLTQLTEAIAAGEDPTSIINQISAALPGVRDTIVKTLEPVREVLDEAFGRTENKTRTGGGTVGDDKSVRVVRDESYWGPQELESSVVQSRAVENAHLALIREGNEGIIGSLESIRTVLLDQHKISRDAIRTSEGARELILSFPGDIVVREDADIDRIANELARRVRDAEKGM